LDFLPPTGEELQFIAARPALFFAGDPTELALLSCTHNVCTTIAHAIAWFVRNTGRATSALQFVKI
jgi:hypothetical protein